MDDCLLLHGFRSQATGDRVSGGLGVFCSRNSNTVAMSGRMDFPKNEAGPPVAWVGLEWGTASPVYSDLLLDKEPRRPEKGKRVSYKGPGPALGGTSEGLLTQIDIMCSQESEPLEGMAAVLQG